MFGFYCCDRADITRYRQSHKWNVGRKAAFEVHYLGRGLFSGSKESDRKRYRWKEKFRNRQAKRKQGGVLKHDPLEGPQAKGDSR